MVFFVASEGPIVEDSKEDDDKLWGLKEVYWIIILAVAGALLLLLFIIICAVCASHRRRNSKKQHNRDSHSFDVPPANGKANGNSHRPISYIDAYESGARNP